MNSSTEGIIPESTESLLLSTSLQALKPPPILTVSEWADTCRVLSRESSAEPGRYRTERTPYLREIMDSVNDHQVEFVVFMKSAQVRRYGVVDKHRWILC